MWFFGYRDWSKQSKLLTRDWFQKVRLQPFWRNLTSKQMKRLIRYLKISHYVVKIWQNGGIRFGWKHFLSKTNFETIKNRKNNKIWTFFYEKLKTAVYNLVWKIFVHLFFLFEILNLENFNFWISNCSNLQIFSIFFYLNDWLDNPTLKHS